MWTWDAVPVRVALVQLAVDLAEPKAERVGRVAALVRQVAADLVILPELWPHGGFAYDRWAEEAEPLDGPTVAALQAAARDLGATVHMGSLVERRSDGRLSNTSLVLDADGEVTATYRKIHGFGFAEGEAVLLTPGEEVVCARTPYGGLGLSTCYDLRFPELYRALLDRGAELFAVPSAWPMRRVEHWRLLARARAVEDQAFVLACNTAGEHAGVAMAGHSVVVDPWGDVVAEAGETEQVLVADIDLATVAKTRAEFPVLPDRRL